MVSQSAIQGMVKRASIHLTDVSLETRMATEPKADPTISYAIAQLLHDLEGIKSAERIACPLIQALANKAAAEYQAIVDEFRTEIAGDSDDRTFYVPVERNHEFRIIQRKHKLSNSAIYQTPRALLVAMVSSFDAYLARLLRCIYYLRPERINNSERAMTFSQLVMLESIEAAREHVIAKEIETFLRDSHVEHFDNLEKLLSMPLRKDLASWPRFVELTQRRNLFVHTDGVVSDQYMAVCKSHNCDLGDIKVGDRLFLDDSYFRNAFECLYEIGVKLSQVVWRKLRPDQLESADDSLNHVCYELLQLQRFRLAHNLLLFGTETLKKHNSARVRRMLVVNRAIAAKFGEIENYKSSLELEDWSDCGLPFQLALAVLNDKFESACETMRQLGTDHKIVTRSAYANWPLFLKFRESEQFLATYRDMFGAEFDVKDSPEKPAASSDIPYETTRDNIKDEAGSRVIE